MRAMVQHDRRERLIKLSRDITIGSKRVIFLLHRAANDGLDAVLHEADEKLDSMRLLINKIASELEGEDPMLYHRAFSPGIQEYIEAVTFKNYLVTGELASIEDINRQLVFANGKQVGATLNNPNRLSKLTFYDESIPVGYRSERLFTWSC